MGVADLLMAALMIAVLPTLSGFVGFCSEAQPTEDRLRQLGKELETLRL